MKSLLEKLGLEEVNAGACTGPDGWIREADGNELISYNPTDNQRLAKVIQATAAGYQQVAAAATGCFETWQLTPAPKRGLLVRDLPQ